MVYCLRMRRRIGPFVSAVRISLLAAALLLALGAGRAAAAPGDLDPSFGGGGSERLFLSHETIALRAVAVQPDGKVVLAGADQTANSILVVRLLESGALDPSFGAGGVVNTPFPAGSFGAARAVALQPDGKIVVAGGAKGLADSDFIALRYLQNGALDPSFGGGDGIEVIPLASTNDRAEAVKIGAGGRILLVGEARNLPANPFEVAAEVVVLRAAGEPDPSFDGDGIALVRTPGSDKNDQGEGIDEQADGKIVVADSTGAGAGSGFTVVRLLANGALDPGWGVAGVVNTAIPTAANPGARGRSTDVAVQPDGHIVAAGYGYDEVGPKKEADSKFAAVRYLPDGTLDPSFGAAGSGIFTEQVSVGEDSARSIALAPNGKLILAGYYSIPPNDDSFAILRLDSTGALDAGFGAGGVVRRGPTAPFGNNFEGAALDSRERVVVVSRDYIGNGNTEVEVSRFLGDLASETGSAPTPIGQPPPARFTPHARMKKIPRKLAAKRLKRFSGTASGGSGVAKVQIAVVRRTFAGPKARASRAGRTCQVLKNARARFKVVKAKKGKICPRRWLNVRGTAKWRFKLKATLPPGHYVVFARAIGADGTAESTFSRAAGNRYGFRLLAHARRHR